MIVSVSVIATLTSVASPASPVPIPTVAAPYMQACLHGTDESPEQKARRVQALGATRNINNMQANQPGAKDRHFLRQEDLATSPFAARQTSEAFRTLNLAPNADILPGWSLTLDVSASGYWFMIKDKQDPCGFAYISNTAGLIYTAEPIR